MVKIIKKDTMQDGVRLQIEDWSEDYSFVPYGSTLAAYAKSKVSHEGQFSPKGNEVYRFQFNFESTEKAEIAFRELQAGTKELLDYRHCLDRPEFKNCI